MTVRKMSRLECMNKSMASLERKLGMTMRNMRESLW